MSIHKYSDKIKSRYQVEDFGLILVILLVGTASFGLGRLSKSAETISPDTNKIEIVNAQEFSENTSMDTVISNGNYVASRNGTKYYLASCDGAKRISEENKIWFNTKEEAELAGYETSSTCDYK